MSLNVRGSAEESRVDVVNYQGFVLMHAGVVVVWASVLSFSSMGCFVQVHISF